jgi:hypothetical protein
MIAESAKHAEKISEDLKKAGFQLQILKSEEFTKLFSGGGLKELLGILVIAGLLSLGSGSMLSNLRPLVAN